ETIVFADEQGLEEEMMTLPELAVPHVDNALAAILITKLAGANTAAIKQVLSTFGGVEHRMEYVATVNGVKYFNDSKATNPEAASRALQAFSEPVVLIAGGLDRGVDFHELVPFIRKHVKALIAYGQTAQILLERAKEAGISERILVDTVDKAVITAASIAQEGDVVLLSPACASWDMF
ncbi:UDP-N-acetylmuramoyl-L-alanine--D-glutamate ligase, partial [Microbacteriaceae bacterium K1510]|nr:UDP-N-acetylmuramoyl-L-alanine--D-glutamate ligase [Microbacteriaceae bacterium K1510]